MRFPSHLALVSMRGLLALAAALLALAFSVPSETVATLERLTIDARHRLRAGAEREPAAVVVEIADSSFALAERAPAEAQRSPALAAMGRPWPWDRSVFAAVVRQLRAAGARAIVFDVVFAATTPGDADFAAALAEPGAPVVLAALFQEQHTAEGEGTVTFLEPRAEFLATPQVGTGFANVRTDADGVVRQTWFAASDHSVLAGWAAPSSTETTTPSLAAAAAQRLGVRGLPAESYINYRGSAGQIPSVPIEHLFLRDRWEGGLIARGGLFRDRVVLIGPTSEVRFKDFHATPLGRMAGVEVQARIVGDLLGGTWLRAAPHRVTILAVLVATALAAALGAGLRRARWHIAGLLLAGVAWSGIAFAAFGSARYLLPVAAPLGALASTGAVALGLRYVGEQRERRRVRRLLSSYVSEAVARVIVRQPEGFEAALRGERRPVTVLFADIRDFTTLTERAAPEQLIAQLNEYLRAAVDGVLVHEGTLQKFIGDAILAVWGDTHSAGERADACRALAAALALERALASLNLEWAGRTDRVSLRIGVGLHQGPAMVGNIGHPRRMEFAVLGDTVNLASRLEGANRFFGTTILAGETVRALAQDEFRFAPVARVIVKGRAQPVDVATPIGPRAEPEPAWLAPYAAAVAAVQAGRFAEAAAAFAALPADKARFAPLFAQQAARARQLAATPPTDWSGAIRLEQK